MEHRNTGLTTFEDIKNGQRFSTERGEQARSGMPGWKRAATFVKVGLMKLEGDGFANAVILLDHAGQIDPDIGALHYFERLDKVLLLE